MARDGKLGPGIFVCVVGPSGAGKDTLLRGAQRVLQAAPLVHFPRRLVTRQADRALEDHDSILVGDFERGCAQGDFALHWHAHGLGYAIPNSADRAVSAGAVVMCNVSRSVLTAAVEKYSRVVIVHVTAPPCVLADRLAARGRESRAEIEKRLLRTGYDLPQGPQIVRIDNIGSVRDATNRLVDLALALGPR